MRPLPAAAVGLMLVLAGCTSTPVPEPAQSSSAATAATPTPSTAVPGGLTPAFFGIHDHDPTSWSRLPVGSLRAWDAAVMWRDIETAPGVYDFSRLDAIVQAAERHGSDVLLVLGQTPQFHAVRPKAASFYGPGASSPPDLAAWAAYVRAVAQRYAGRPVIYEVWNEANIKGFWRGTPAELATLTKTAYDVLSELDPRPTLLAPSFTYRLAGQQAWFRSFWAEQVDGAPVSDFVDVVSVHLYPADTGTPETSMQTLAGMQADLQATGVDKPLWNTEINYGFSGLEVDPAPELVQRANVARTLLLNASAGVGRVYWYALDQRALVNTLLTSDDGQTPSAAGRTWAATQRLLLGRVVQACTREPAWWSCEVRGGDAAYRVYWTDQPFGVLTLPAGARAYGEVDRTARPVIGGTPVLLGPVPMVVRLGGAPAQ